MPKYIEANALIQDIQMSREQFKGRYPQMRFTVNDAIGCIRQFPAADVEPVIRAEWAIPFQGHDHARLKCTECGAEIPSFYDKKRKPTLYRRCPSCGAHMKTEGGK